MIMAAPVAFRTPRLASISFGRARLDGASLSLIAIVT